MIGYMIFTLTITLSVCCSAYDTFARRNGWPVGEVLAKDASTVKIVALIAGLLALGKSFFVLEWWSPFAILAAGWILAFALTMLLKKTTQILCIVGIFPAAIATILYISESKPFGMLHRLFD
jgi:Na+(H+)/acetate symporter ActP